MENQHRKITGYRDLDEAEVALINKIKALGTQIEFMLGELQMHLTDQGAMLGELQMHITGQVAAARSTGDGTEQARIESAQPGRWIAIARTDFQTGLMALTRAVAQPGNF